MAKTKKFSAEELNKAIDEAFALGVKMGREGKKVVGILAPDIEAQMNIVALNKSIDDNSKKINHEILERHREQVNSHMKEWAKDADKALNEILTKFHTHTDK